MNKKIFLVLTIIAGILVFSTTMAFSRPAKTLPNKDDIIDSSSASRNKVNLVARFDTEPVVASHSAEVISPGTHENILGYNAGGTFIEITKEGAPVARGWVSSAWVSHKVIDSTTRFLTKAYMEPSTMSSVVSILTPQTKLQVIGHSVDGLWMAVADLTSMKTPIYWVASSDIRLPDVTAQTETLTKFYLRPDSSSRITTVLPPTEDILLIGRIKTGGWYAVADLLSNKFLG